MLIGGTARGAEGVDTFFDSVSISRYATGADVDTTHAGAVNTLTPIEILVSHPCTTLALFYPCAAVARSQARHSAYCSRFVTNSESGPK